MSTCRFKHTCSLLKDTNEIVIIGGSTRPTNSSCDRVRQSTIEILDLDTNTFRDGKFKSQDIIIWINCNIIDRDLGTPFPMASQAHATLPYEDSFLIMGGLRCPPSECDDCRCKKCQRSSAINKSVLLQLVGKSVWNIMITQHNQSNNLSGTMWQMDRGLKCQWRYQLPWHTQLLCTRMRIFAKVDKWLVKKTPNHHHIPGIS